MREMRAKTKLAVAHAAFAASFVAVIVGMIWLIVDAMHRNAIERWQSQVVLYCTVGAGMGMVTAAALMTRYTTVVQAERSRLALAADRLRRMYQTWDLDAQDDYQDDYHNVYAPGGVVSATPYIQLDAT